MNRYTLALALALVLPATAAHAENWIFVGVSSRHDHTEHRVSIDGHSLRPVGPHEYRVLQRDDYAFAQTQDGKTYTTEVSLQHVRCDTRAITATKITLRDDTGQVVYDSGEPLVNRVPKKVDANSIGEAVVNATCD